MPFFPIQQSDMVARGLQRLRDHSNITQLSPGAKMRLLLEVTTDEQFAQHELFDDNIAQTYIRWADGRFLDYFGDMLNIPRLQAQSAEVQVEDQNFIFYVDGGTFGDINNQLDFTIPSGIIVSTPDFPTEQPTYAENDFRPLQDRIEYDLLENVVCRTGQTFAYGRIRARVEGSASDVPRNVLQAHSFTAYVASTQGRLRCTNKYAIATGRDRETDEAYRYRLTNAFKARERANRLAIRLASLSVPGVRDVFEFNCEQGPGTFALYVQSLTPTTSPTMIRRVQEVVDNVSAIGVRPFVLAPVPVGLEFVIAVNWKSNASTSDQAKGYADIRRTIEIALDNTRIGTPIDLEGLATAVTISNKFIQGIGLETSGWFEEVYINRPSADEQGTHRSLFTGTQVTPLYNERVILETNNKYRGVRFL